VVVVPAPLVEGLLVVVVPAPMVEGLLVVVVSAPTNFKSDSVYSPTKLLSK